MKLTDTQLVLLSAASQREDRGIELGSTLRGGAAYKVLGKALTKGPKRCPPTARFRSGGGTRRTGRWRCASPSAVSTRSRSTRADRGRRPGRPADPSEGPTRPATSATALLLLLARRPRRHFPINRPGGAVRTRSRPG